MDVSGVGVSLDDYIKSKKKKGELKPLKRGGRVIASKGRKAANQRVQNKRKNFRQFLNKNKRNRQNRNRNQERGGVSASLSRQRTYGVPTRGRLGKRNNNLNFRSTFLQQQQNYGRPSRRNRKRFGFSSYIKAEPGIGFKSEPEPGTSSSNFRRRNQIFSRRGLKVGRFNRQSFYQNRLANKKTRRARLILNRRGIQRLSGTSIGVSGNGFVTLKNRKNASLSARVRREILNTQQPRSRNRNPAMDARRRQAAQMRRAMFRHFAARQPTLQRTSYRPINDYPDFGIERNVYPYAGHEEMGRSQGFSLYSDMENPRFYGEERRSFPESFDGNLSIRAPPFDPRSQRSPSVIRERPTQILDMEIQRKIASIQSRARMQRSSQSLDDTTLQDFRAPVLTSNMSLSERFKFFHR